MDLKTEFEKRGPWITDFEVDGIKSGGTFPALEDERITQFSRRSLMCERFWNSHYLRAAILSRSPGMAEWSASSEIEARKIEYRTCAVYAGSFAS